MNPMQTVQNRSYLNVRFNVRIVATVCVNISLE